jgi:hypothetical protein
MKMHHLAFVFDGVYYKASRKLYSKPLQSVYGWMLELSMGQYAWVQDMKMHSSSMHWQEEELVKPLF